MKARVLDGKVLQLDLDASEAITIWQSVGIAGSVFDQFVPDPTDRDFHTMVVVVEAVLSMDTDVLAQGYADRHAGHKGDDFDGIRETARGIVEAAKEGLEKSKVKRLN